MDADKDSLLRRFLAIRDFDEYMEEYESFHGLTMGKDTFRQEMHLMESDGRHTHREKDRILQKRKRDLVKKLRKDLEALRDETARMGVWREPGPAGVLKLTYRYPDGRNGDLSHYAAQLVGNIEQLDEDLYQVMFSSDEREFLEIAAFLERSFFSHYDDADADETAWFLIRNNRIAELEYRMWYLNYYTQEYRNIRSVPDLSLKKMISDYRDDIMRRRDAIYEKLIIDGVTNARWVSEQKAFSIVKKHFPDAVFQYRAEWLHGQRLDIFIPGQNCGIEYQGLQHTEAVDFFGGEKGLKERQDQDRRKWMRCRQNGVKLLYWDGGKPLTEEYFLSELYPRISGLWRHVE